jgi:hypothetical protein
MSSTTVTALAYDTATAADAEQAALPRLQLELSTMVGPSISRTMPRSTIARD